MAHDARERGPHQLCNTHSARRLTIEAIIQLR